MQYSFIQGVSCPKKSKLISELFFNLESRAVADIPNFRTKHFLLSTKILLSKWNAEMGNYQNLNLIGVSQNTAFSK